MQAPLHHNYNEISFLNITGEDLLVFTCYDLVGLAPCGRTRNKAQLSDVVHFGIVGFLFLHIMYVVLFERNWAGVKQCRKPTILKNKSIIFAKLRHTSID